VKTTSKMQAWIDDSVVQNGDRDHSVIVLILSSQVKSSSL